jgi:plastocyanin
MLSAHAEVQAKTMGGVRAKAQRANKPRTFTVLVGAERRSQGVDIEAYFPDTLHIHIGDTVVWRQNANEIHTVTFLAGAQMPQLIVQAPKGLTSTLMYNPKVAFPTVPAKNQYDGSSYASSGIMGRGRGQPRTFRLTFTEAGTYTYLCLVHGQAMSGKIIVEDPSVHIASPATVAREAIRLIATDMLQVPAALKAARLEVPASTRNTDGTVTHHVLVGFKSDLIDLMRFFPQRLVVRQGDTVDWTLSKEDMAPHTVTILNGARAPALTVPVTQTNAPPLLLLNPTVLFPQDAGQPLTRRGIVNSGLMNPGPQGATNFMLKIGDIRGIERYMSALQNTSGMTGWLTVLRQQVRK